jgi:probable F420-dependent oxidoreductase
MQIGVVFPQTEIGASATVVRAFAEAVEGAGYRHLLAYDHVLGASTKNRPDWRGPYTSETQFHEVFILFAYLAGITTRLEFVTGVLVLPQRQTALVAKQSAELDEFVALDENFTDRGRRSEEQIEVLRALWTNEVVDYTGRYHRIPEAGIKPLPIQQPIPVWIGGYAPVVMERIGRLADGWFPGQQPGEGLDHDLELIAASARAAGRDPSAIQMEGRINIAVLPEPEWAAATEAWRVAGATHLSVVTMGGGLDDAGHIRRIERYAQVVGTGE